MIADSLITRLEKQLSSLETQVLAFMDASTIEPYNGPSIDSWYEPLANLVKNSAHWGEDSDAQKCTQLKLLKQYESWFEQFDLLFL